MNSTPGPRRGTLFFWLAFLVIAGAIFTTVLAANDGRNYRRLMNWMGFKLAPQTMVIPKPGLQEVTKGRRLKGAGINIDTHLFMSEAKSMDSAFMRSFARDGGQLCTDFAKLGVEVSKWQPGAFTSKINECYAEEVGPDEARPDDVYSFFLIVKGTNDRIVSMRVKFIYTDDRTRDLMVDRTIAMLGIVSRQTRWLDLMERADDIRKLKPFSIDRFGVSLKFIAEFSGIGRYNLIIAPSGKLTRAERRTRDYFDAASFLRLPPEYGIRQDVKEKDVAPEPEVEQDAQPEPEQPAAPLPETPPEDAPSDQQDPAAAD